jgi:hypothetical protein
VDRAALWGRLAVAIPALELPASPASTSSASSASASPPLAAAKAVVVKIGLAAFVGGVTAGIALDRAVLLREAPPPVTAAVSVGVPVAAPRVPDAPPAVVPALVSPSAVATVSEPGPASPPALAAPAAEARSPAAASARAPSPRPVVSPPVVSPPVVSPAPAAVAPTPVAPSTLAEERELIDVAAAALGAGQLDAVRSALSRHHQRFPSGALTEEREGLSVLLAIAEYGWGPEVEAQHAQFARAFPQSPLLLRLQAARARALEKGPTDSPASPQ